ENSAELRARACAGLETLGLRIAAAANTAASQQERAVSHAESPIQVLVIPTNEELQIAREAVEAVEAVS
ncbi:MAG: acetate kinase, partial [Chromatiaceae bacterium]|nr:acetate kinase [Chromatiaceae bacterium]